MLDWTSIIISKGRTRKESTQKAFQIISIIPGIAERKLVLIWSPAT